MASGLRFWLCALGLCLAQGVAIAHENLPASLMLQEAPDGEFTVRWRVPNTQGMAPDIAPVFAADCTQASAQQVQAAPGARLLQWRLRCASGLRGAVTIGFAGLERTMVDVLVRVAYQDGSHVAAVARARAPQVTWGGEAATPGQSLAASGYFGLGLEHILTGVDHLLLVLCLVLLVPGLGALLKTLTAFSLAHSLTLALAALQWVRLPQAPVEATIALSIVFLARELARPPSRLQSAQGMARRSPWVVALAFGLLHGLGFAGALAAVGLPPGDVPLALLLFNLGVEAGQLLFVAAVLPLVWLARRWWGQGQGLLRRLAGGVAVYALGAVAAFWWLQRMVPVLGWRVL